MIISVGTGCIYEIIKEMTSLQKQRNRKFGIIRHTELKNAVVAPIQPLKDELENCSE